MADSASGEITALLRAWHAGDEAAYRQAWDVLYKELRHQAARRVRARPGDTLQTTALVHETFIRLAGAHDVDWQDRKHFLAVASRAMRRVLVDFARARGSAKRGARAVTVPLDSALAADSPAPLDLLALDRALEQLAAVDARKVRVVELKFFLGLTVEETADILDVSSDTVARDWRMARTWLLRELRTGDA